MSDWSEPWLRDAAGWRAVKEGKSLLAAGRVEQAAIEADTCRGTIREGKGLRRVVVRQKSRHDVETRCGCAENRATGALCAHAAAVILAAIRSPVAETPRADIPEAPARGITGAPAHPLQVEFSPRWCDELARGRLNVKISRADSRQASEADQNLSVWLESRKVVIGTAPRMLQLSGADLTGLLETLARHEPVATPDGPVRLTSERPRLMLGSTDPDGDMIGLHSEGRGLGRITIGHSWLHWQSSSRTLHLGAQAPAGWDERQWSALCDGKPVQVPLALVLAALDCPDPAFEPAPESWLALCRVTAVPPRLELRLDGTNERIEATLTATYPGDIRIPAQAAGHETRRILKAAGFVVETTDPAAESLAAQTLVGAGMTATDSPGRFRLNGQDAVADFATGTLPDLHRRWQVIETPAWLAAHRKLKPVRASFVQTGSGEDWFSFDVRLITDDGQILPSALAARLLRSKGRSIETSDGNKLRISEEEFAWLEGTLEDLNLAPGDLGGRVGIEHLPHLITLRANKSNTKKTNELQAEDTFVGNERIKQNVGSLGPVLRDYQLTGVSWLNERMASLGSALLADDMGLGKTIQTLAWVRISTSRRGDLGPVLVVCPTSLVGNWRDESAKFTPELRVAVLHGTGRDEVFEALDSVDLAITTYGSLVRDRALHLRREYAAVVLDEASVIRNPDSEVSRCVAKLRAKGRLALTGTPVENRLADLWAIFRFLRPGYLCSRERFREVFELPCAQGAPPPGLMRRLHDRTGPFLLRRTKSEVAADLPPKLEIIDWCEMSPVQRGWYAGLAREGARVAEESRQQGGSGVGRLKVLTALLRLRQACCDLRLLAGDDPSSARWTSEDRSGKLSRLLERVREAVDGGHRVLVFSQFATMLGNLREALEAEGFACCLLDGSTRDRAAEVQRFRAVDGPPVFLISLKAGGYGLNLQEADTVIHYDPWWNPAAEAQASDRAHRIGQTRPVTVYKLLTRGTVEEKVLQLQDRKRAMLGAAFGDPGEDGSGIPSAIRDDELLGLLDG